jgi:hypothetical protein
MASSLARPQRDQLSLTYDVPADGDRVVLIRPDGYIGLVADAEFEDRVFAYLSRVLAP